MSSGMNLGLNFIHPAGWPGTVLGMACRDKQGTSRGQVRAGMAREAVAVNSAVLLVSCPAAAQPRTTNYCRGRLIS